MANEIDIHLFRHGEARYQQGFVRSGEANDLTTFGMEKVAESANKLANFVKGSVGEPIVIASSPTGRTLQTAEIISKVLRNAKIPQRERLSHPCRSILVISQLQDQKNYDVKAIKILVEGGRVEYKSHHFFVDSRITNPSSLPLESFGEERIVSIPKDVLDTFPTVFVDQLKSTESLQSMQTRMTMVLKRIFNFKEKAGLQSYVLVSHDAPTRFLVTGLFGGRKDRLNPGEFLSLQRRGNALNVRIGNLEEMYSYTKDFANFFDTHE